MSRIKQPFSAGYSRNRPLFITGTPHSDANPGQFAFNKTYDPGTEDLWITLAARVTRPRRKKVREDRWIRKNVCNGARWIITRRNVSRVSRSSSATQRLNYEDELVRERVEFQWN